MRKKGLWIFCIMLLLMGCQSSNPRSDVDPSKPGSFIMITLDECIQMMKDKKEFVVAFTQDGCPYCEEFYYYYDEYRKDHHLMIYQVNLSEENRSEQENLIIILKYFPTFYNTPGIYYVRDGKVVSSLTDGISMMDEKVLTSWVDKNQLLTLPEVEVKK